MNCNCPECQPRPFLKLNRTEWLLALDCALAAVLLRVLFWAWN